MRHYLYRLGFLAAIGSYAAVASVSDSAHVGCNVLDANGRSLAPATAASSISASHRGLSASSEAFHYDLYWTAEQTRLEFQDRKLGNHAVVVHPPLQPGQSIAVKLGAEEAPGLRVNCQRTR